ncbi:hypothetical protein AB4Y36_38205 [Paraburkholderia sp. BR10936]|uniref:hypothetical protein n=1 Tax=Paraburkholderia sp. BR10936 TaxID=3236993 RepID=UPI0034D324EB
MMPYDMSSLQLTSSECSALASLEHFAHVVFRAIPLIAANVAIPTSLRGIERVLGASIHMQQKHPAELARALALAVRIFRRQRGTCTNFPLPDDSQPTPEQQGTAADDVPENSPPVYAREGLLKDRGSLFLKDQALPVEGKIPKGKASTRLMRDLFYALRKPLGVSLNCTLDLDGNVAFNRRLNRIAEVCGRDIRRFRQYCAAVLNQAKERGIRKLADLLPLLEGMEPRARASAWIDRTRKVAKKIVETVASVVTQAVDTDAGKDSRLRGETRNDSHASFQRWGGLDEPVAIVRSQPPADWKTQALARVKCSGQQLGAIELP